MKEKLFQAQVIQIAKRLRWKVYHTYDSRRCEPGFPDLVLVRERVLFRELKTDTGRVSSAQNAWGDALMKAGCDFKIWRPRDLKSIKKELL